MSDEYNKVFEDVAMGVRTYTHLDKNIPLKNILDLRLQMDIQMEDTEPDEPFGGWVLGDLSICRRELVFLEHPEENHPYYSVDEIVPENMEHPDIVWEEWEDEEGEFSINKDFPEIEEAVVYFEERAKKRGYIK